VSHITPKELALWQKQGFEFDLLDVRRAAARSQHGADIASARWHDPAAWLEWKDSIGAERPVVLYCAKGHEISQALTTALRVMGVDARYLAGGMQGWVEAGGPVTTVTPEGDML
jgi:rhodanese-related sulfurtransferase